MSAEFPTLFSSLEVDGVHLSNRIIMGSMHTGLEGHPFSLKKLGEFYRHRARGGVGLIVTGGFAPNMRGWLVPFSGKLSNAWEVRLHRQVTDAVHEFPTKILCQLLHAGRYAYHPWSKAPSAIASPISRFSPSAMTHKEVRRCIDDFVRSACLAKQAGYDGVEVMGSEGYLIHQFFSDRTNQRNDEYGRDQKGRMKFALEIVEKIREKVQSPFLIMFRLPMIDLLPTGSTFDQVLELGQNLQQSGVSIINSGIGWHESRVPTIASMVPHGAFAWVTEKFAKQLQVPLVASNRINSPEVAENILLSGQADFVSMARPFLADAQWVEKVRNGKRSSINICIACNQACLDHIFEGKKASCLVNPQACHETDRVIRPTWKPKKLLVVGAGPAGMAFAYYAAKKGHHVHLWEKEAAAGGQFTLAAKIPGKEEFQKTISFYLQEYSRLNVQMKLGKTFDFHSFDGESFDEIVFASGVRPRVPRIDGMDHPKVIFYDKLLTLPDSHHGSYAIVGAGGIGFDVAEFLSHRSLGATPVEDYCKQWNIDQSLTHAGGLSSHHQHPSVSKKIFVLQRKASKPGKDLSKTTGWIRRKILSDRGVEFLTGVSYDSIDDRGIHIRQGEKKITLEVDRVVICAGQESVQPELPPLTIPTHWIGGCRQARELDAKSAILDAFSLAAKI
ncbi:MAG: NADPH-dependent 2,4-dienoyl-CoA reductase [Bdellovibrionota bacterium]